MYKRYDMDCLLPDDEECTPQKVSKKRKACVAQAVKSMPLEVGEPQPWAWIQVNGQSVPIYRAIQFVPAPPPVD
jgi:hypothetical protein